MCLCRQVCHSTDHQMIQTAFEVKVESYGPTTHSCKNSTVNEKRWLRSLFCHRPPWPADLFRSIVHMMMMMMNIKQLANKACELLQSIDVETIEAT